MFGWVLRVVCGVSGGRWVVGWMVCVGLACVVRCGGVLCLYPVSVVVFVISCCGWDGRLLGRRGGGWLMWQFVGGAWVWVVRGCLVFACLILFLTIWWCQVVSRLQSFEVWVGVAGHG